MFKKIKLEKASKGRAVHIFFIQYICKMKPLNSLWHYNFKKKMKDFDKSKHLFFFVFLSFLMGKGRTVSEFLQFD